MAEFPDAQALRSELAQLGWRSPDTYTSRIFSEIPADSGVYLFLAYPGDDFDRALVGYVGMSMDLRRRVENHEVLAEIRKSTRWQMRWFLRAPAYRIRDVEREYIGRFDPPWNIIGRPKGIVIQ